MKSIYTVVNVTEFSFSGNANNYTMPPVSGNHNM